MMPCFDGVYYCILRNEVVGEGIKGGRDRKSTRLNSSHSQISYAVFCLKKKTRGIDSSVATLNAPADSLNIVTPCVSPHKASIFACIPVRAASCSSSPRFAMPSSRKLKH